MSPRATGTSGRLTSWLWVAAIAAVIIALLYFEQTALLYVLATLSLSALLIIVAVADLGAAKKSLAGSTPPADDAAAIGTGIGSTLPAASTPPAARTAKRK